jgi:cation transport ATPase
MESMARDMRNRFLVALAFTVPIILWSMRMALPVPFGIDRDVWLLLLSLPVVLYASIFFTGAVAALRARTLDMMVLVAVAIGTGWIYSVAATFFVKGAVFYDASAMLATFVLLGHWFEMRQNLAWAVGYDSLALPIAAGIFEPLGLVLRPEVGAISMSGSSVIVALNAVALKRLRLPPKH